MVDRLNEGVAAELVGAHSEQRCVIAIGATSAVAQALLRLHVNKCDLMVLAGRDQARLDIVAADLIARGASVETVCEPEFAQAASIDSLYNRILQIVPQSEQTTQLWYVFHGQLPDQKKCEADWSATLQALQVNFMSVAQLLGQVAQSLEQSRKGKIIVVSSVAGLRGRQSNYIYGTAKGALNLFLQGLRNRLAAVDVPVITILPGFIKTPMTEGMDRGGFLWATPEKVAADIYSAQEKNKNIVYTPWFWRIVMGIICSIPESIFKRLKL